MVKNAAGAASEALLDYATGSGEGLPLMKAEKPSKGEQDAPNEKNEGQDKTPGGGDEDNAKGNPVPDEPATDDPKTLFWDPFAIIEQLGYKERPSALTYGTLRSMVYKMPIIQAIIQTRLQQMAAFCQPSRDRYDLGFRIATRESKKEPTKEDQKWIQQAQTMIMRTGVTDNPRGRDTFETFTRKVMWDSMAFDQACIEIVPDKKGRPCEWYAVDASTMRLADTASTYLNEDKKDAVRYVQIYDGMIIAEYNQEEMCFGIRNPRTDIRQFGYGTSELEMLLVVITALLYGWDYNQKLFTQGTSAKGILNFKGAIPERQLKAFRRHWYQMVAGPDNFFRTPVTNAEELQWISLQNSSRDMEFNAWFDFLIKVGCSMYSMDPSEINFKYGNTGQSSALTESNNSEKVTESKERGLRPLLRFLEGKINQHILWPINENFEFRFCGLDARTKEEMADLNTKLVKSVRTIDEIRAEDDLPALPDGQGKIILDPTWMQFAMAQQQQKQQAEQQAQQPQGQPGQPGQEGQAPGGGEEGGQPDFEQLLAQYGGGEGGEEKPEETAKSMDHISLDLTV